MIETPLCDDYIGLMLSARDLYIVLNGLVPTIDIEFNDRQSSSLSSQAAVIKQQTKRKSFFLETMEWHESQMCEKFSIWHKI